MGVDVKLVVMNCCEYLPEHLDLESDELYADLDSHSTFKRGQITYLYDGMCGNYLYVGEVIGYLDDPYQDFTLEIDEAAFKMKDEIEEFCLKKFGYKNEARVRVINHVY